MLGSHLSIAGGLVNALHEAKRLRLECVQVFTKNQRQWRVRELDDDEVRAWLEALDAMGWDTVSPTRVVSHNSYLINLASPDPEVWEKSVRLQRIELERCERLRIPVCVAHPGAHMGAARPRGEPNPLRQPPSADELAGLRRIVKALDRLHRELPGYATITLLETTVGAGTALGYDFAHLRWIRDHVREPERVAYCFDTCHVTAAGYDMTTDRAAEAVLDEWDNICGHKHLRAFHLNDSVGAVGSRTDRHAHIGFGQCGLSCFRAIVNRPEYRAVPMVLETEKADDERGTPWDVRNIRRLRRLIRRPVSNR